MEFPKNLKKIRKRKKVSQKQLASALDVGQSCIANWEAGIRDPKLTDIVKLSTYLDVSTNQLTGTLKMGAFSVLKNDTTQTNKMPLFTSQVSAGFPSPADDYIENRLDLNDLLIKNPPATFFVKVTGESMIDAGINDGDILIVDKSKKVTNNNIVIAVLNGELTVKRIEKTKNKLYLVPENPAFPKIEVTDGMELVIWGVVTNVIHQV